MKTTQTKKIDWRRELQGALIVMIAFLWMPRCGDVSADRAAVTETLNAYFSALNAGQVAEITARYDDDGVFMPPGFPAAVGRNAVKASYTAILNQIELDVVMAVDEVEIQGDIAFARTTSRGQVKIKATGQSTPEANKELFVLRRNADGAWKIARYCFNRLPK